MSGKRKYRIDQGFRRACAQLGLSEAQILRRSGLAATSFGELTDGIDAQTLFAMWIIVAEDLGLADPALTMGRQAAAGPLSPALMAYSCSPTIETGFRRLSVFKPLVGPCVLAVDWRADGLAVTVASSEPSAPMPAAISAFELVFLLECARLYSGSDITPARATLPDPSVISPTYRDFVRTPITQGPHAGLVLKRDDATRPLYSEDTALWAHLEQDLTGRLRALEDSPGMTARVQNVLIEILPSGDVSMEIVSRKLGLSRRSLQRHLQGEGHRFQDLLSQTRAQLATAYLEREDMGIDEISHLLAFRDPNSFYRAFQSWTGKTPLQARRARAG